MCALGSKRERRDGLGRAERSETEGALVLAHTKVSWRVQTVCLSSSFLCYSGIGVRGAHQI